MKLNAITQFYRTTGADRRFVRYAAPSLNLNPLDFSRLHPPDYQAKCVETYSTTSVQRGPKPLPGEGAGVMRDAFINYRDGRRIAVSDLPTSEVVRLETVALTLKPNGNSERTPAELRDRLQIELIIRQNHWNGLL